MVADYGFLYYANEMTDRRLQEKFMNNQATGARCQVLIVKDLIGPLLTSCGFLALSGGFALVEYLAGRGGCSKTADQDRQIDGNLKMKKSKNRKTRRVDPNHGRGCSLWDEPADEVRRQQRREVEDAIREAHPMYLRNQHVIRRRIAAVDDLIN